MQLMLRGWEWPAGKDDCVVKAPMPDRGNLSSFPGFALSSAWARDLISLLAFFFPPPVPQESHCTSDCSKNKCINVAGTFQFKQKTPPKITTTTTNQPKKTPTYKSLFVFLFLLFYKGLSAAYGANEAKFSQPVSRKVRMHLQCLGWHLGTPSF